MSHLRLQLGSAEAYDGSGDFDEWLRRLLSHLRLDKQRYKTIAQHSLEYFPEGCTRGRMAQFNDADVFAEDPAQGADYVPGQRSFQFTIASHPRFTIHKDKD